MKRHLSFLVISSFLLTGCWSINALSEEPLVKEEDKAVVVLFSDEKSLQHEGSFYDALLELQQHHPNYAIPLKIVGDKERNIIREYNITQYPTMIIVNTNGIDLRIEGMHPKDEIVAMLKQALNITEEGTLY